MGFKRGFTLAEVLVGLFVAGLGATLALSLWFGFFTMIHGKSRGVLTRQERHLLADALSEKMTRAAAWYQVREDSLLWLTDQGEIEGIQVRWNNGLRVSALISDRLLPDSDGWADSLQLLRVRDLLIVMRFADGSCDTVRRAVRSGPP